MRPAIRPFCTLSGLWLNMFVWICVCLCQRTVDWWMCFPPICVKTCTCKGEKAGQYEGHVFTGSLSCECIMFPVNMPLPNKRGPVLSARTRAPQRPGPNVVQFCTGTIYQEFSSTDTAVGLISIQSICTGISAVGEESVYGNEMGKLHSETFSGWTGFRIPHFTYKKMPRIWVRLPLSVPLTEDLFVGFKSSLKCSFPQDHQGGWQLCFSLHPRQQIWWYDHTVDHRLFIP